MRRMVMEEPENKRYVTLVYKRLTAVPSSRLQTQPAFRKVGEEQFSLTACYTMSTRTSLTTVSRVANFLWPIFRRVWDHYSILSVPIFFCTSPISRRLLGCYWVDHFLDCLKRKKKKRACRKWLHRQIIISLVTGFRSYLNEIIYFCLTYSG